MTAPNSMLFDYPVHNYMKDFPFIWDVWDEVTVMVTYESNIDLAKKHILDSAKEMVGEIMRTNYDIY